jgi:hypothetical protein
MLAPAWVAHFLTSGFALKFNHLHRYDGCVTGTMRLRANAGAAVDVRARMNAGSADG